MVLIEIGVQDPGGQPVCDLAVAQHTLLPSVHTLVGGAAQPHVPGHHPCPCCIL